jgi:O-antigen ligase
VPDGVLGAWKARATAGYCFCRGYFELLEDVKSKQREKRTGGARDRAYNRIVKFILRWIWPVYVFAFPTLMLPGQSVGENHLIRVALTLIAVLIACILEIHLHGTPKLNNAYSLIRRHPVPFVAFAYGTWALSASMFAIDPAISFTGNLIDYSDGAVMTMLLCLTLALVYIRTRRDQTLEKRLVIAIALGALILCLLAITEFVRGRAFVYPWIKPDALPVTTFPGPGLLTGYLLLCSTFMIGWWFRTRWSLGLVWVWLLVFISSFAIALTNRRTALPALGASILSGVRTPIQAFIIAIAIVTGVLGGQKLLNTVGTKSGVRSFGETLTLTTRSLLWRAAIGGVAARPVTGWGGGGLFQRVWHRYLSREQLTQFIQLEYGLKDVIAIDHISEIAGGEPWFYLKSNISPTRPITITPWKAHNQWLDTALSWGLVGLALYFLIAALTLRQFYLPGVLALVCYQVYLLLWYVPLGVEGVLFVVTGFSAAMGWQPTRLNESRGRLKS